MTYTFDAEGLRKLISGAFQFRACITCSGRGWEWVDGHAGEVVNGPDPLRDASEFYRDECEDCNGLGGRLSINE